MKIIIWLIAGLLLLLWTGFTAVTATLVNWVAGASLDPAIQGAKTIASAPVPEWISVWMPPAVLEPIKTSAAGALESALAGLSWLSPVLGWISPLLWLVWALVTIVVVALAVAAHLLVRRKSS